MMARLNVGDTVERRAVETIQGASVGIPDGSRLTHLQLRRFAGCPMCNLHLRSFVRRYDEIVGQGIREVVVFHSSRQALLDHHAQAPFDLVADPTKALYRAFGVETSIRSVLHPGAWLPALKGVLTGGFSLPAWRESPLGLPADLLIEPDGRVLACKYGTHAYDHWSVDELITLVRTAPAT